MRTTLTLEDDLVEQINEVARETRRPFKVVVNETLRRGLSDSPIPEPVFRIRPHAGRLQPGIDDRGFNELAWDGDGEKSLRTR